MTRIRFDHIAIGMSRMADATEMLVGTLGGVPAYGQPSGVFRWASWTFEGGRTIEILEPMGDHGFLHRFLDERGPGVHHVTIDQPPNCSRILAQRSPSRGRSSTRSARVRSIRQATSGSRVASGSSA